MNGPTFPPSVNTNQFNMNLSNYSKKDVDSIYLRKTENNGQTSYKIATTKWPNIKAAYHFLVSKLSRDNVSYVSGNKAFDTIKQDEKLFIPLLVKMHTQLDAKASQIGSNVLNTTGLNPKEAESPNNLIKKANSKGSVPPNNLMVDLLSSKYELPKLSESPYLLKASNPQHLEIITQIAKNRVRGSMEFFLKELDNYGLNSKDHGQLIKQLILSNSDSYGWNHLKWFKESKCIGDDPQLLKDILIPMTKDISSICFFLSYGEDMGYIGDTDKELIAQIGLERAKNGADITRELSYFVKALGKDSVDIQNMISEQVFQGKQPIRLFHIKESGVQLNEELTFNIFYKALDSPTILPDDIREILSIPRYNDPPSSSLEENMWVKVKLQDKYELDDNRHWVPLGQTKYYNGILIQDGKEVPLTDLPGFVPTGNRVIYL